MNLGGIGYTREFEFGFGVFFFSGSVFLFALKPASCMPRQGSVSGMNGLSVAAWKGFAFR